MTAFNWDEVYLECISTSEGEHGAQLHARHGGGLDAEWSIIFCQTVLVH